MSSHSSQADSAGSIPVTRSTHERCCSRTELEDSSSLRICVSVQAQATLGHTYPQFRTHPSASQDAQLIPSSPPVRFPGLPTSPGECLRKYELDVNGLNYNAAKNRQVAIGIRRGSNEEDPPCSDRYLLWDRARIGSIQSPLAGQLRVAGAGAVNRDSLWLVTPTPGTLFISADPHHFSASREDRSWCRGLAT
jgi:hypothetical protein